MHFMRTDNGVSPLSFISVGLSIPIMLAVISFIELLITNIRKKKGK